MSDESKYPVKRNLDGVYFRVKRDDKWENVCFSDLTHEERDQVTNGREIEWMKQLAYIMANSLREIGEYFDIFND